MGFKFVILWTDGLIYILCLAIICFAIFSYKKQHLRAPWRKISRRKIAVTSMVILSCYVIFGLLDSIHYQHLLVPVKGQQQDHYSPDVRSLLDLIYAPLGKEYETSYSAPFSAHLYVKKAIVLANGTVERGYPKLKYGAAHLQDPLKQRIDDIVGHVIKAVGLALVLWVLLTTLIIAMIAKRSQETFRNMVGKIWRGATNSAFRTFLITLLVMIVVIVTSYILSRYYHIFGTDEVGQDVFYQSLKSIRTGLIIGTLTTLVMLPFALFFGTFAGFFGGIIDDLIQYFYITLNSIPSVLLISAVILSIQIYIANHAQLFSNLALRADVRLLALCLILGVTHWTSLCRMLRGETLKLREMDYIQAARSLGVSPVKIIYHHILPNLMHIILVVIVLDFSVLVLAEAVLSYVGVGVDPLTESWGNMINAARLQLAREPIVWWPLLAAFLFMFTLVLAANLFADAVREAFDPRIHRT